MVSNHQEGRPLLPKGSPGLGDDLWSDPGGIAHGHRERRSGHGVSIVAEFLRSRRERRDSIASCSL